MALHIISNTIPRPRLRSAITQIAGDDEVVILGLLATEKESLLQDLVTTKKIRCHQIADSDQTPEPSRITTITYDRFVELTVAHKNSLSWY